MYNIDTKIFSETYTRSFKNNLSMSAHNNITKYYYEKGGRYDKKV